MTYEEFLEQHRDITDTGIRLALLALRDRRMDTAEHLLDDVVAHLSTLRAHRIESQDAERERLALWNRHKSTRHHKPKK